MTFDPEEARALVDDLQLVAKCLKGENKFPTGQSVILEAATALTAALAEIERLREAQDAKWSDAIHATSGTPDIAWWLLLGVRPDATSEEIQKAYRDLVRKGGSATVGLNAAIDAPAPAHDYTLSETLGKTVTASATQPRWDLYNDRMITSPAQPSVRIDFWGHINRLMAMAVNWDNRGHSANAEFCKKVAQDLRALAGETDP